MTPEIARQLIEEERAAYPRVVDLARHLSLAVRIESELLRSMRLQALSGIEAGVEADLYFSPLVQTRDINAITLIPEVREQLHQELAQHKDELELARKVTESAHDTMDAAILLEERVAYHALRDDQSAYADMQRQLGQLILELERSEADPGLLGWAVDAYSRLPDRARNSQAGRHLTGLLDNHLQSLGLTLPVVGAGRSVETSLSSMHLGFRAFGNGVELCYPHRPGWVEIEILAADPLSLELAWPVPEGWQSHTIELSESEPVRQVSEVPPGLLRLRGINGDETRLRVEGPFKTLKPKLLGLYRGDREELPAFFGQELEDLSWALQWRRLRSQDRPQVFLSMPGGWRQLESQYEDLKARLEQIGFSVWSADEPITPGDEWNKEISRVLAECRSAVVVLTPETQHRSSWLKHELSILAWRQETDPDFSLHVMLSGGLPPEGAASLLAGMELPASLRERIRHESPESVARAIQDEYADSNNAGDDDFTAAIVHFPDNGMLADYANDLANHRAKFVKPLEDLIFNGRPVLIYAGGHYQGRLHQGVMKYAENAQEPMLQDALLVLSEYGIKQQVSASDQEVSDRHQLLRSTLLDVERGATMDWLRRQQEGRTQQTPPEADGNELRWKIPGESEEGHRGTVRSIAISDDGVVALTAGNSHPDQTVKQWDLKGRRLIRTYEKFAEAGGWTPMAISPDGRRAAIGYGGELRLIDLESGEHSALMLSEAPLTALAFVDEERVLTGMADGMLLLVGRSGVDETFPVAREQVLRLDVRGQQAACLRQSAVELLDLRKGALLHRVDVESGEAEPHWQRPPLYYDKAANRILFGTPLRSLELEKGYISTLGDPSRPIVEVTDQWLVRYEGESAFGLLNDPGGESLAGISITPEQPASLALARNGSRLMIADYEHNLYLFDLALVEGSTEGAAKR